MNHLKANGSLFIYDYMLKSIIAIKQEQILTSTYIWYVIILFFLFPQDWRTRNSDEGVQRHRACPGDPGALHQDDSHLAPLPLPARRAAGAQERQWRNYYGNYLYIDL